MMNQGICYIVGALPVEPELIPHPVAGDLLIAADAGYQTLVSSGLTPDFIIGDFDSLGYIPEQDQNHIIRLPKVKDETDMGFALNHALTLGYTKFLLLGGLGGRLEHTIANLQLLTGLTGRGIGILAGQGQAALVLSNRSISFPENMSGFCSVFCLGDVAHGVTLQGMKYPLQDAVLTNRFPLGVSNEFLGLPVHIQVKDGTLLLIWEVNGQSMQTLQTLQTLFDLLDQEAK